MAALNLRLHGHVNCKNGCWKKMNGGINKFHCKEELAGMTRGCSLFSIFCILESFARTHWRVANCFPFLFFFCFFKKRTIPRSWGSVIFGAYLKILSWRWVGGIMEFLRVVGIKGNRDDIQQRFNDKRLGSGHRIIQLCCMFRRRPTEAGKWNYNIGSVQ